MFVQCQKDSPPDLPEDFEIHSPDLMGGADQVFSVFVAVKMGPSPRFGQICLINCDDEDEDDATWHVEQFLDSFGGGEIRMAPAVLSSLHNFRVCLGLVYASGSAGAGADDILARLQAMKLDDEKAQVCVCVCVMILYNLCFVVC